MLLEPGSVHDSSTWGHLEGPPGGQPSARRLSGPPVRRAFGIPKIWDPGGGASGADACFVLGRHVYYHQALFVMPTIRDYRL